jgi:peptide/nickel transport system substrate-binding protein
MPNPDFWTQAIGRRRSRRALLRAGAAGVGIAGSAAAGCGGGGKPGGGAPSGAGPSGTGAAGGTPSASGRSGLVAGNFKTGGTLQLQLNSVIGLDPFTSSSFLTNEIISHNYSRLFRFVAGTEPSAFTSHELAPDLVDTYEVGADGLTYTLKLRRNVMFHPPLSRPLTSADVMASWQRLTTDPKSVNGSVFKPFVDSLTAPDDFTLVFKLKAPYAPFLNKLASAQYLWIISKDAVDGKIDPSKQLPGTGPWMFVDASPTAYTFKKNPDYYIKGIPYADGAVLNVILDFSTREAQFQAGKLDVDQVPIVDTEAMQKALPKAHVASYNDIYASYVFFSDVSDPQSPFNDVRMRRAVSLALDRKGLLDAGYNGHGAWTNIVNPGMGKWWLDPQGTEIGDPGKWFKHDPAQAKQLLNAAGHANTELKFLYPNNAYGEPYNTLADAARGMLADAGFKLTVVTVDYNKDYMNSGQGIFYKGAPPNTVVFALQSRFSDADDYLFGFLAPDGNRNQSKVNDPNLTALIKKEQAELDEAKRLDLAKQIQKATNDQMYYAPGYGQVRNDIYQSWIDNPIVTDEYSFGLERHAYLSINR